MTVHRLVLAPDITEIPRLIDWVETCCTAESVIHDTVFKLTLALEEAIANVINHAFGKVPPPHRLAVELAIDADRVCVLVVDSGAPFDPSLAPEPDKEVPLEKRDPGGLGIHLIRRMMDRVDYRRVDGENRLRLEKARK